MTSKTIESLIIFLKNIYYYHRTKQNKNV